MHQPVEMPSGLLDLLAHVIVAVEIKDVGDEIKRVLVVLDFRVETCEVEAVGEVVLVDLAEIFVAARGDELFQERLISTHV